MNMRDGSSGKILWSSANWGDNIYEIEVKENIPKEILDCRTVSREINFSSSKEIKSFRLIQRVYFLGDCIEEWFFKFGFVMAGSSNSWQQVIEAAPKDKMIPAHALSGNVVFETSFYDGDLYICKNSVRIFYV